MIWPSRSPDLTWSGLESWDKELADRTLLLVLSSREVTAANSASPKGRWTSSRPRSASTDRPARWELTTTVRRRLHDELRMAVGEPTRVLPDVHYLATDASSPGSAPADDGGAGRELDAISDDAGSRDTGDLDVADEVESGCRVRPSVVCQ
jgi:hypothetical protein